MNCGNLATNTTNLTVNNVATNSANITSNAIFNMNNANFATNNGKRKRVVLTMNMKLHALERIDRGESIKQIANELGVGASTVSDWRKNRNKLQSFYIYELDSTRRTLKKATNNNLDDALWFWFVEERKKGTLISGPLLRQVALDLNVTMNGPASFTASTGWLTRWKKRHGVDMLPVGGESFTGQQLNAGNSPKLIEENHLYPDIICKVDDTESSCKTCNVESVDQDDTTSSENSDTNRPTSPYKTDDLWPNAEDEHLPSTNSSSDETKIKLESNFPDCDNAESLEIFNEYSEERKHTINSTPNEDRTGKTETNESSKMTEEISHFAGGEALDLALRYVRQQTKSTQMDIFFMKKWRDFARKQISNCKRQKKITDFFT